MTSVERGGLEKTLGHLCSRERDWKQFGGGKKSFNTVIPERLRSVQHPSFSIFFLFTSRFMSLHANSITGIKIVCPIYPQTLLPLSVSLPEPPTPLTDF